MRFVSPLNHSWLWSQLFQCQISRNQKIWTYLWSIHDSVECKWTMSIVLCFTKFWITNYPQVKSLANIFAKFFPGKNNHNYIRHLYCACVFLVTRPFTRYHNFWPCILDLEVWPTFKNFNLGHNFQTTRYEALTLHMCIPCEKTFHKVP